MGNKFIFEVGMVIHFFHENKMYPLRVKEHLTCNQVGLPKVSRYYILDSCTTGLKELTLSKRKIEKYSSEIRIMDKIEYILVYS